MKYYPAFLRLAGRACLVVGGGEVGTQKVSALASAGAAVTVVSSLLSSELEAAAAQGLITLHRRAYRQGDVHGFFVIVAATNDVAVQNQIAEDARAAGILINVVDRPELCDFIVPSILEQGDLLIAVSTCGQSPTMARRIREDLQSRFGPAYAQALVLLGKLREHLAAARLPLEERKRILGLVVDSSLVDHLEGGDGEAIDQLLANTTGSQISLATLGIRLS